MFGHASPIYLGELSKLQDCEISYLKSALTNNG